MAQELVHFGKRLGELDGPARGAWVWNFLNACIFQYGIAAYDLQIGKYLKGKTDKEEFRSQGKKVLRIPLTPAAPLHLTPVFPN